MNELYLVHRNDLRIAEVVLRTLTTHKEGGEPFVHSLECDIRLVDQGYLLLLENKGPTAILEHTRWTSPQKWPAFEGMCFVCFRYKFNPQDICQPEVWLRDVQGVFCLPQRFAEVNAAIPYLLQRFPCPAPLAP
ncbi:MAG TPA: hypothetical protein PKW90_11595 [Myxococcota bacterium]|nr:hypothetical protein [Myxococcota bacterium]